MADYCRRTHPGLDVQIWWKKKKVKIESRKRREELKSLGNAIVPLCAEIIGRAILAADQLTEAGR
jgi:site-specific DNA-cytosine methylase